MKWYYLAVALNHLSQLDAWRERFQQAPYKDAAGKPRSVYQAAQYRNWAMAKRSRIPQGEDRTMRRNGGADCRQYRA